MHRFVGEDVGFAIETKQRCSIAIVNVCVYDMRTSSLRGDGPVLASTNANDVHKRMARVCYRSMCKMKTNSGVYVISRMSIFRLKTRIEERNSFDVCSAFKKEANGRPRIHGTVQQTSLRPRPKDKSNILTDAAPWGSKIGSGGIHGFYLKYDMFENEATGASKKIKCLV